jgi:hypothetical protein
MTSPHDRPTAAELIEAVREFLESEVLAATEGRVQFHTRVAVNALGMVERELSEGASMASAHRRRLDALGFADDEALAAAIRDGQLDVRRDEVFVALYETVVEKVRVANPDYLEGDEAKG